jgi:hypothetical protein
MIESGDGAPRPQPRQKGLVDTSDWLREAGELHGMRQVLAVQSDPSGRHLVAAANEAGEALFLLNSHGKGHRAHMGLGLWCREAFLIGPSRRIQRSKGHSKVLGELLAQLGDLRAVRESLAAWKCPPDLALAAVVAKDGYLASEAVRPSPKALIGGFEGNMLDLAFEIVRRMRKGNLASMERDGLGTKSVTRPAGLFHAGIISFDAALSLAKDAGLVADEVDFGDIYARRVRE